MNHYWNKIGIFVKLMRKVSMKWKNWSDFKDLHSIKCQEEDLIEDRDTILELTGKIQESQNETNCVNESRDFSRCWISTKWTIPRFQSTSVFPTSSRSWWNAEPFSGNAELDTHGFSGNIFTNPTASPSAPCPQESDPRISNVSEHTSPHMMSESQTPVQDQRCQSTPSARNSVIPSGGRFSKNYGADQQRLQILDPHFWQIPHVSNVRFLEDKIQDWGMYLFTISYGSYAVDQRSGVGWFSGWSQIFVLCKRNSNAKFWSTRFEDCFSTEQDHP